MDEDYALMYSWGGLVNAFERNRVERTREALVRQGVISATVGGRVVI